MRKPDILVGDYEGIHNRSPQTIARLDAAGGYEDQSTVIVIPAIAPINPRVVECWWNLMTPMNQKAIRMFIRNAEVGEAYNLAVDFILANPVLSTWRYMLTLETDNMPPPDGLLRLLEAIRQGELDAVGGLYWTKGEGGMPMIYGNPKEMPKMFNPQMPQTNSIQECNGLGMGFTLFRLEMFRKIDRPWFKTLQEFIPGQGTRAFTQDLYFFDHAAKHGFRFACDTRVRVGHYDDVTDRVW